MSQDPGYWGLRVYHQAKQLAVRIHRMTLESLPRFEMDEEGPQIRRSSKSVVSNIVEGFGRRRYKGQFLQFLTYALASANETRAHLEMLQDTGSLAEAIARDLMSVQDPLLARLYRMRDSVDRFHRPGAPPKGDRVSEQLTPYSARCDDPATNDIPGLQEDLDLILDAEFESAEETA